MLKYYSSKLAKHKVPLFIVLIFSVFSCNKQKLEQKSESTKKLVNEKLFTPLNSLDTGVDFVNILEETLESNYFQYNYTYIGAGVASADFNNDGLVDLFFTSNSNSNKLYLNKGNLKFEDITAASGIKNSKGFDTGVTVADVNNDGFLDIYICRGGWIDDENKFENLLYINNGDLTFTEKAKELGLNDANRSINAVFFDFDNDNDLDVYISNTPDVISKTKIVNIKSIQKDPATISQKGSDHLYENDGTGHFINISKKAGIKPELGFGLNPQVMDFNNDGYLDIYVSNDFNSPDLAYLNNGNGTFTESSDEIVKHMAFNSMGSDVADINNDGLFDFMALDMNPENYIRSKTTMGMVSLDQYDAMVKNGYHHQYMHNVLQLNNGNGTYSEISKLAGISNTDWSWAVLSADFDLDGYNDVYVTNGVYRDVIDKDKNNEILQILRQNGRKPTKQDFLGFAQMLPQQKLKNYFYKNNGDLTFDNVTDDWNTSENSFSNGATYADLDNDGDLDIVVNNINDNATILKNNAADSKLGDFIQFQFKGPEGNKFGNGAKVSLTLSNNEILTRQLINTKGFLSSVSNKLHFGLDKKHEVKKIDIVWNDGKKQAIHSLERNKLHIINYEDSESVKKVAVKKAPKLFQKLKSTIAHIDSEYNDYEHQVLLPHKLSQLGPAIAKTDLNNDGIDDVYVGGGHNQAGKIYFGRSNNSFKAKNTKAFVLDKRYEDTGACFFDADNDGDMDLYVVSGSYEFVNKPRLLFDRLYINNGNGNFVKSKGQLPQFASAGFVVTASDYDNDGDIDLFVGGRVIPGKYPYAPVSTLLINNKGKFSIGTKEKSVGLAQVGMVTDAVWYDINGDKQKDLIVCGEWMGIEVFLNTDGKLEKSKAYENLNSSIGWWNKLLIDDIDNDGDDDIVVGNLGLNYKYHASKEKPFHIYTKDFDYNGVEDIFLAKNYNNKQVPIRGKGCTAQQMPHLKRKITSYNSFANLDLKGIVGNGIKTALHYEAVEFRSGIFKNEGGKYVFEAFLNEAQKSPINSILYHDFDKDGIKDLLMAGNNYQSEIETTRADAGVGVFLKGEGDGNYKNVSSLESGFFADKDIRNMYLLKGKLKDYIFIANNNDKQEIYSFKK
jgi:hypothetical protein